MVDAASSLVLREVGAATATRVCEIQLADGRASGPLLRQYSRARLFGLAWADGAESRERLRLALTGEPSLRNRTTVFFGDKMRTVRAAPALDACDVMVVSHDDALGAATTKKLLTDLPNILQRMASQANALVMRGPACSSTSATTGAVKALSSKHKGEPAWCASWAELVERRLVAPRGCPRGVGPGRAESWCVGRVATESACARGLPLLPALPVRPAAASTRDHRAPHPWLAASVQSEPSSSLGSDDAPPNGTPRFGGPRFEVVIVIIVVVRALAPPPVRRVRFVLFLVLKRPLHRLMELRVISLGG